MSDDQQIEGLPQGATVRPIQQPTPAASDPSQVEGLPEGATLRPVAPPAPKPTAPKAAPVTRPATTRPPYAGTTVAAQPKAPEKDLLTSADEDNAALSPAAQLTVKAARGVRGLYHGVMGDEESATSKGPTSTASPVAENLGFTPEHVGQKVGEMGRGVYEFGKGLANDLLNTKTPVVVPDKPNTLGQQLKDATEAPNEDLGISDPKAHTLLAKYITAPSQAEHEAAVKELEEYGKTHGAAAVGHAISAFLHGTLGEYVPAIGPLAMSLTDQAAKGDIGGSLAQLASLYAVEKGTGKITKGIKERVGAKVDELTKSPEVKQAEENVESTKQPLSDAQAKYDAAAAEHAKYSASHAQGIDSPKPVRSALDKAQADLDEAQAHHDLAKEHLEKEKAAQPTIPQKVGGAVGRTIGKVLPKPKAAPEVPAENIEAAPVAKAEPEPSPLTPLGNRPPTVSPAHTTTVIPQEPTAAPRPSYGRIQLANEQGTMGTPKLLTEGTPEGPQVPKGGLPKINIPEEKPAVGTAADLKTLKAKEGKVVDTEDTIEGRVHKLLQEALKPEEPKTKEPYTGEERREKPRPALMSPVEIEQAMKNRKPVHTPFDVTEGAMDTIKRDQAMPKHPSEAAAKPKEVLYRGTNADEARKIEESGKITPDAFSSGHLTPDKSTAEAYAKANGGKVYSVDASKVSEKDLAHYRETGRGPITLSSEVPTVEHAGRPTIPKEEGGYAPKKEAIVPAGEEGREPAKSAAEYHPVVEQKVSELSDENLRKLAKAHGLNPDEYDFNTRDERRHRTERDQLAKDITEQMGEDEKINIGRAAEAAERQPGFENRDRSAKANAERASNIFPRLRGPVDEYGNPKVSGGAPEKDEEAERLKSHIAKTSAKDTDHLQAAMKELGPDAKLSDVMRRAQEIKTEAAKGPVDVAKHASSYNKAEGLPEIKPEKAEKSQDAKLISDEYEKMKHDPKNPAVKKSYEALIDDVKKQWNYATKKMGINIEPTDKDPYGFSGDVPAEKQLVDDVKNNKHLGVWRGGNPLPEDHPLAKVDPETGENYNTMFRAVHDIFGHVAQGHDFSEPGEESAWNVHRQMMSPEAVPAMTTETRGQTSWFFNHGDTPGTFAEQKAGLLPDFANEPTPNADDVFNHIKSGKDYAVVTAENPNNTRLSPEENAERNRNLMAELKNKGYEVSPVEGHTKDVEGNKEHSFFVKGITPEDAAELGRKHGQAAVLTTEGLHDLKDDTVTPSDNGKLLTGEEAKNQPYYSTVAGKPFSVSLDFDKAAEPGKAPLQTVSGGSQGATTKKLRTGDELIKKYGESSGDPKDVTFILKDGRAVANTGSDHDVMLGGRATDKNPPRERFIAEGNIRVRAHQGTAGRETAISIPESGINKKQLQYIQKMAPQLASGAVMIEIGKPHGLYSLLNYGKADAGSLYRTIKNLGVPILDEKGAPIDEFGNPTVSGGVDKPTTGRINKHGEIVPEVKAEPNARSMRFVVKAPEGFRAIGRNANLNGTASTFSYERGLGDFKTRAEAKAAAEAYANEPNSFIGQKKVEPKVETLSKDEGPTKDHNPPPENFTHELQPEDRAELKKMEDKHTIIVTPEGKVHSYSDYNPSAEDYTHSSLFNSILSNHEDPELSKYQDEDGSEYDPTGDYHEFQEAGGIRAYTTGPEETGIELHAGAPAGTIAKALRVAEALGRPENTLEIVDPKQRFNTVFSKTGSYDQVKNAVYKWADDNGMEVYPGEKSNPEVSGGSQSAGTSKAKSKTTPEDLQKALPELAQEHLTPEEKESITTTATGKPRSAGTAKFVQNMSNIPTVQEYTDIALQGEGARKWYSRSSAAFDALAAEAPEYFKPEDKQKFLGVLAGDSPQQAVSSNLKETLAFWKEWHDAGRPELSAEKWKQFGDEADKAWKEDGSPRARGMAKGASMHWDYAPKGDEWKAENLLLKNLTLPDTKVPNIIKAINGEQMWPDLTKNSAFKAPSFAENLRKWIDGKSTGTKNVTNDSWMGLFGGIDKSALSKPENYHPLSVATRAAAEALGWEPEEAQAAIWSFTQALTEKGTEDPEVVRHYSEDFKDLLANDLETREKVEGLGVKLDDLDKRLEAIGDKPEVSGRSTPTTADSVRKLRSRIEEARGKGAIPEPKSIQGNLFRENPNFEHRTNPGAGVTRTEPSELERIKAEERAKADKVEAESKMRKPKDEATEFNPEEFENESPLFKLGEKKKKSPLGKIR